MAAPIDFAPDLCIRNPIMAWAKVTKPKDMQKDFIFMREIAMDREFKPTLNDNTFKTRYCQIVTDIGIETLENLKLPFTI